MVGLIEQNMSTFPINSRIKVNNSDYGTIKYFGEIKGYNGLWVGVEWDDPLRGKHNGTINGITYFETSCATSGSMIRPGKVGPFETLADAIQERYNMNVGNPLDEDLMKETKEFLKASIFEFVGAEKIMEKQSHVEDLLDISVAYSNTNSAGNLMQYSNLVSVNLTGTLIWNWRVVADIVGQLPSLSYINLSQNRLQLPSERDISDLESSFRHLKTINLSHCKINAWQDVLHTARLFPLIESLSLQGNDIESLTSPNCDNVFKNLQSLDLHMNKLSNFSEILKLGNTKTLRSLLLMKNNIKVVKFPDCEYNETVNILPNLEEINLKDNPIEDELMTFNELDKLPQLTALGQTPNDKTGFEEMFSRAVALIGSLKRLNKIEVTSENRRGAEYDIWKQFGWEYLQTADNNENRLKFLRRCRAYFRIVEKYGSPDESIVKPKIIKSQLITINIIDSVTKKLLQKRVPIKMSLQTLQGLVIKLLKSDTNGMNLPTLMYIDAERNDIKVVMDNMSKSLDYYSIQDGDTVLVVW